MNYREEKRKTSEMTYLERPIVVRGGGDLATGTILMLSRAGYPVIILETECPTAIRREVAFSEAVRYGTKTVENTVCRKVESPEEALAAAAPLSPVLLVDGEGESLSVLKPQILIDAILAKKNLGTRKDMADLTIALGPGFCAGSDVDYVIETMRGHNLGRIISEGYALPNTGTPGVIAGYGKERVIHAPADGVLKNRNGIGDIVEKDEPIAVIDTGTGEVPVPASLSGVLRGILPDGFRVYKGLKMADIDPRISEQVNCYTVSDKSRCIAGSVLQLVCAYEKSVGDGR